MAPQAKKKFEVQPGWCGQQPTSPRYSRSTTGGLGDGGGPFWIRHPPPLFFPSPKNWLFCMSGLIQTRGIFSRAPLSPCEPLKRSRDGGKKSAGKKFIFPNLGTGTGFRNRPGGWCIKKTFPTGVGKKNFFFVGELFNAGICIS